MSPTNPREGGSSRRTIVHVGDAAVARVAALAASAVPGVVALRPALAQLLVGLVSPATSPDGVSATVQDGTALVTVTVVTRLGVNCRDLAEAVQRAVTAAVTGYTGLAVEVGVVVADVFLV